MNEKLLADLSARLAAIAADNPAHDLEKNFRAMLSAAFARLDLVTRELLLIAACTTLGFATPQLRAH